MARKATEEEKIYIKRYKELSGDTTPQGGLMTVRRGLINRYVCRLCGKEIPFKDVDKELDKLTGYCRSCMAELKEKELILAGDPDAIARAAERQAGVDEILQAMREGRVQELFRGEQDEPDPEEDLDEDDEEIDEDDDF